MNNVIKSIKQALPEGISARIGTIVQKIGGDLDVCSVSRSRNWQCVFFALQEVREFLPDGKKRKPIV